MFFTQKKIAALVAMVMITVAAPSCNKDSDVTPEVTLSSTEQTVDESVGTVSLTIDLGEAATSDVIINYTLSGTAILNGDYEVTSGSSITIKKGNTVGSVDFSIFDDQVLEDTKSIIVNFTSSSVTLTSATSQIDITDNEPDISASGLQTDLTWDAGTLVNLDLYTANNVVIGSDNTIESFTLVDGSTQTKGFESLFMNNTDDDDEFYTVINYESGSRAVAYKLNYNGPSITNMEMDDSFATTDVGYAVFYGPIVKSGSTYSRTAKSGYDTSKAKAYTFRGKLK